MLATQNIKPSLYFAFAVVLLFPNLAYAPHGPNLDGLGEALRIICLVLLGATLFFSLIARYSPPPDKKTEIPASILIQLAFFILLASKSFLDPELNLVTLIVIVVTLLFCLGIVYFTPVTQTSHVIAGALLLVSSVTLLSNEKILTLNNHLFVDEPPFVSDLMATQVTHPVFGHERLANRLLQTTDGALYYGQSWGFRRAGGLVREAVSSCGDICENCSGDCTNIYSNSRKSFSLVRPRAFIQFQRINTFPRGDTVRAGSLINIPIKDNFINPNEEYLVATLKLVSTAGAEVVWNPSNYLLWDETCIGRSNAELAEKLIRAGADVNFSKKDNDRTTFHCALQQGDIETVRLFAKNRFAEGSVISRVELNDYDLILLVVNDYYHNKREVSEKKEILEILIDQGLDINARDKDGQTILYKVLAESYRKDQGDLLESLLFLGLDKGIENREGQTPLEFARYKKNNLIRQEKDAIERQSELTIERTQKYLATLEDMINLIE